MSGQKIYPTSTPSKFSCKVVQTSCWNPADLDVETERLFNEKQIVLHRA